jgi:hypothetical protein
MSASVRTAQILFFINAAIWLILGIASLLRMSQGQQGEYLVSSVMGILMFGNAGVMALCGILLGKQRRLFLYMTIGVLAINVLLTLTDQVGALDLITLTIDVILLGLLYLTRSNFSK